VLAGKVYSGSAATTNSVQLSINNVTVLPAFSGITSAGLYQLNVVQLPAGPGVGDMPLLATVGGVRAPSDSRYCGHANFHGQGEAEIAQI
jgi:uncharacterized protein (TIGR03437 family)